jgi:hypothetical protein
MVIALPFNFINNPPFDFSIPPAKKIKAGKLSLFPSGKNCAIIQIYVINRGIFYVY